MARLGAIDPERHRSGKMEAAREGLKKILADHPENKNATAALRALDSGELPMCPGLLEGI